jgi:hypothetical protein
VVTVNIAVCPGTIIEVLEEIETLKAASFKFIALDCKEHAPLLTTR